MRLPPGDLPQLGGAVVAAAVGVASAESTLRGVASVASRAGGHTDPVRATEAVAALTECVSAATSARLELLSLATLLGQGDLAVHAVDAALASRVTALPRPAPGLLATLGEVQHDELRLLEAGATIDLRVTASMLPPGLQALSLAPFLLLDDGPGYARSTSVVLVDGQRCALDLAGWFSRVDAVPEGSIAVTALGNGRWVVQLPGIHSFGPAPDPQDLPDAAQVLETGHSAYERSVVQALALACVPPGAQLMLVGHSQGGIVAAALARDPAVTSRWRVTHVVTAGSPVSRIPVPAGTSLLEVDNDDDLVPDLDAARSHDGDGGDRTVLRFHSEHGSVGADHGLAQSYEPYLRGPGARNARERAWVAGAAPYLGAGPAVTTVFALLDAPPTSPAATP